MTLPSTANVRDTLLVLAIAIFSASCGASRPIEYYSLDPPGEPLQAASSRFPISILVARVTGGPLYRDDRLVYRTSELELGIYEYRRWSEPPVDMIQESLISALRSTKQYRSVDALASNMRANYIVRAHLEALDEIDKPELAARFSLHVDLYDPKSALVVWSDSYAHDQRVGGKKVIDVVRALDQDVQAGIRQMTGDIGSYFASHPAAADR